MYSFSLGLLATSAGKVRDRGKKGGLSAAETGRETHRTQRGLGKNPACDHEPGSEEQEQQRGRSFGADGQCQVPDGAPG